MRKPVDVVNVAASRCATSWIWLMLSLHPEVSVCRPKELNYFIDKCCMGPDWYESHFNDHEKVTVDISPMCYYYSAASKRIMEYAPETKLLCVLRNPYDRAIDQISFYHRQRRGTVSGINLQTLRSSHLALEHCLRGSEYYNRLEPFCRAFPKRHFRFIYFDVLTQSPSKFLRQVYEAVGVDRDFKPDQKLINKNVNAGNMQTRFQFVFKSLRRGYLASYKWKPTIYLMDFLERRFDFAFKVYRLLQKPVPEVNQTIYTFEEVFGHDSRQRLAQDLRFFNEKLGIKTPEWN